MITQILNSGRDENKGMVVKDLVKAAVWASIVGLGFAIAVDGGYFENPVPQYVYTWSHALVVLPSSVYAGLIVGLALFGMESVVIFLKNLRKIKEHVVKKKAFESIDPRFEGLTELSELGNSVNVRRRVIGQESRKQQEVRSTIEGKPVQQIDLEQQQDGNGKAVKVKVKSDLRRKIRVILFGKKYAEKRDFVLFDPRCIFCSGKGYIRWLQCGKCTNGTDQKGFWCKECKGSAVVPDPDSTCETCKGSGVNDQSIKCGTCGFYTDVRRPACVVCRKSLLLKH